VPILLYRGFVLKINLCYNNFIVKDKFMTPIPLPCLYDVIKNLHEQDKIEFEIDIEKISDTTTCTTCGAPMIGPKKIIGTFMGHYRIDDCIYDDIILDDPIICTNCGTIIQRRLFWCGVAPGLTEELFRDVEGYQIKG
jgi:hypothetical protein